MFEELNVLSATEIESRHEVALENYVMKRQIESRVTGDIAQNHIIPTAVNYQNRLIANVQGLLNIFEGNEAEEASATQKTLIKDISNSITQVKNMVDQMLEERRLVDAQEDLEKKAEQYANQIKPLMDGIREHSDHLEMLIDDELWPMPKLRELLFTR